VTNNCLTKDKLNLVEYMAFIMIHLQSNFFVMPLGKVKMYTRVAKESF